MIKSSHLLLAKKLINNAGGFNRKIYEKMFLIGSIQPDINPLTTLKGSIKYKKFGGHFYNNSKKYVEKHIDSLNKKENNWGIWEYYTLGKLTHYIADQFTTPHNTDRYKKNIIKHLIYEKRLSKVFKECMQCYEDIIVDELDKLNDRLYELHNKYRIEARSLKDDSNYILDSTNLLMSNFRKQLDDTSKVLIRPIYNFRHRLLLHKH